VEQIVAVLKLIKQTRSVQYYRSLKAHHQVVRVIM
jgi:hypothetical protein